MIARALPRTSLSRRGLVLLVALVNAEFLALLLYALRPNVVVTNPLYLLVPFVWIDVAVLAAAVVRPPSTTTRHRYLAAGLAVGYFLVLGYFGGLVGPSAGALTDGVRVNWALPPGWGPSVHAVLGPVVVVLLPYKVAGYAALTYLVYATVLEAAGSAWGGVVGLFSCVSCSWPLLGTLLSGVFGSGSALASAAANQPYGLSTLVFCSAVALLLWRPSLGSERL